MQRKCRPRYIKLACLGAAIAVAPLCSAAQPAPPSETWHYERLMDGMALEAGEITVPVHDRQRIPIWMGDGEEPLVFEVVGSQFDWQAEKEVPSDSAFSTGQLRFKAVRPGGGSITVGQHEPGEQWRFTQGDFSVVEREAFDATPKMIEASAYVNGDMVFQTSLNMDGGGWAVMETGRGPDTLIPNALWAGPGGEDAETPIDLGGYSWVEFELPPGYGRFYGLAFGVGAEWVVTAGGQELRAVSTVEDATWAFELKRID